MRFEATVAAFAAALADPAAPPPAATLGRSGAPDARRFSVYRNNVAVGLIGALEARFPVARRMLGDEAFRGLARAFATVAKPRSPVITGYGAEFPDFLDSFAEIPGLADVARLENAWVEAYHSAEAGVATLDDLARIDPRAISGVRVAFHPAARLLRFATPAASIWAAHQHGGDPAVRPTWRSEDVLVARPDADVLVRILPDPAYAFAARLCDGETLAEAAETLPDPSEFGAHFVGLVAAGAIASITVGDPA
jgi:hypothetical protein